MINSKNLSMAVITVSAILVVILAITYKYNNKPDPIANIATEITYNQLLDDTKGENIYVIYSAKISKHYNQDWDWLIDYINGSDSIDIYFINTDNPENEGIITEVEEKEMQIEIGTPITDINQIKTYSFPKIFMTEDDIYKGLLMHLYTDEEECLVGYTCV